MPMLSRRTAIAALSTTLLGLAQASSGSLYVSNSAPNPNRITVHPNDANGNVAPLRTISGFATQIEVPFGIFFDRARGEIFVTDREGSISVFPRTANGKCRGRRPRPTSTRSALRSSRSRTRRPSPPARDPLTAGDSSLPLNSEEFHGSSTGRSGGRR
jgi:hypothetical protein